MQYVYTNVGICDEKKVFRIYQQNGSNLETSYFILAGEWRGQAAVGHQLLIGDIAAAPVLRHVAAPTTLLIQSTEHKQQCGVASPKDPAAAMSVLRKECTGCSINIVFFP